MQQIIYCIFVSGGLVLDEHTDGPHRIVGTAEEARARVHAYFDDLRDTINRQEEAGLAVVNTYVREKLLSLRQQQEDMAVLISQVAAVCTECERALQKTDAEVCYEGFPSFLRNVAFVFYKLFQERMKDKIL